TRWITPAITSTFMFVSIAVGGHLCSPRISCRVSSPGAAAAITTSTIVSKRRPTDYSRDSMNFLAIETSCDETSVAIFTDDLQILANVVASQVDLHARFGGVVPEVAARAHLQQLLPTLDEALKQANLKLADISAVVVMNSPGLVGALLVGVSAAKMLALTLD